MIKYFLLIILLILIIYLKFLLPIEFLSYENYHGIEFLNSIYFGNYDFIDYFKNLFLYGGPDDGHINRVFYGYFINLFDFNSSLIFYIQSFLSIISYIFLSFVVYYLSNKNKYISLLFFTILLVSPHQIKYSFSDDYYILGNLCISISLFSFIFFLKNNKIIYFMLFLLFFIFSIYSRTLYLLYIPIFLILGIYYIIDNLSIPKIKTYINANYIKIFVLILLIFTTLFPITERYKIILNQENTFGGGNYYSFLYLFQSPFYLIGNVDIVTFSYYHSIFIYICFILLILFLIINKYYQKIFLSIILFIYILFLFDKFISTSLGLSYGALDRHILFLEPLYLFYISLFIYGIYSLFIFKIKSIKIKNIIFIFILIGLFSIPFFNKEYILKNYSYQKEYIFLRDNIKNIGNNLNLVLVNNSVNRVEYDFPVFLINSIKDYNFTFYNISNGEKNRYSSFIDNYENTKYQNNIFYLSTACYSSGDNRSDFILKNGIREDCKYILDNYNLEKIVEYKMLSETYIIPHLTTSLEDITIGFYKIKGKK